MEDFGALLDDRGFGRTTSLTAIVVLILSACLPCGYSEQAPGNAPPADPIVIGMSAAFTGPIAQIGQEARSGLQAAISEINRAGGVGGRPLVLVALDDAYEPSRTIPNMHALIKEHNAAVIACNVGTPTAVAAVPIANQYRVCLFGAITGGGVLRKIPPDRYVFNYRASYFEEVGAMVDALVDKAGIKPQEIAFFTQRDTYGDTGYSAGVAALTRHGLVDENSVPHVRYERNTLAVENALADLLLLDPPPKAVIMVGTYAPCAEFIRLARKHSLKALFLAVSFVDATSLAEKLGAVGDGTIVTQVVPDVNSTTPLVLEYRQALKISDPGARPSFISMEAYACARLLVAALKKAGTAPTRDGILTALENMGELDLGLGCPLRLSPKEHQACHCVWPTVLRGGQVLPMDWDDLIPAQGGTPGVSIH